MTSNFDYSHAFSRNIGWLTREEQSDLRHNRVAIAGMGGVGGSHLLTLARLGIGAFNIADFDGFELPNFNRQAGAFISTLGQKKVDVLARMARDINPELDLRVFDEPIGRDNVEEFMEGVDIYVDGLDFFQFEARFDIYSLCERRGIPGVIDGPMGLSAASVVIQPKKMTFDQYFGLRGQSEEEQAIRFLVGLAPALAHRAYLVDPDSVDFDKRRGPSTGLACELCAGFATAQTMKLLLGRGKVLAAPHALQYDAYRDKFVHTWRPGGYRNPLQQLTLAFARNQLKSMRNKR